MPRPPFRHIAALLAVSSITVSYQAKYSPLVSYSIRTSRGHEGLQGTHMRVHEANAYNKPRPPLKRGPPLEALCSIRAGRSPTGWLTAHFPLCYARNSTKP